MVDANKNQYFEDRRKSFMGSYQLIKQDTVSSFDDTMYIREFEKHMEEAIEKIPEKEQVA